MAIRRDLARRLLHLPAPWLAAPSPMLSPCAAKSYMVSPDIASRGLFRRFLQRRAINQATTTSTNRRVSELLTLPVGNMLRDKLSEMSIGGDRIRLDGLPRPTAKNAITDGGVLTVDDVKRIVRAARMEKVKEKLRMVPQSAISYSEFVQICTDSCNSEDEGMEFAKLLDGSSTVIVWGDVVFLRPEQVAKSMEMLISQTAAIPNDPRKRELEEMEKVKAQIDKRAQAQVRMELYGGLGLMLAQTFGFMRLTFWELSWDVMEPICFFVTSMHFALAYGFFIRTSTEPSFEGVFRRRFKTKQAKLMKTQNFDVEKYDRLCKAFYPSNGGNCYCSACK